jgi:hypothetical protein
MQILMFFASLGLGGIYFIVLNQTKNQIKLFLNNYVEISDRKALDAYKALVRVCMYYSLMGIAVFLGMFILCAISIIVLNLRSLPVVFFILLIIHSSSNCKNLEQKVQSLYCVRQFENQYQKVTEIWKKKALPEF